MTEFSSQVYVLVSVSLMPLLTLISVEFNVSYIKLSKLCVIIDILQINITSYSKMICFHDKYMNLVYVTILAYLQY